MPPLNWEVCTPDYAEALGPLPRYINADSADPIWRQIDARSQSGWFPEPPGQWDLTADNYLTYPGLPPLAPAARAYHLGELILAYPHGFVCIVQLSGAFSVARIR